MNLKNFPKKLDSKTSTLRITVPENLDLALEGLIRKVLREQPQTDDLYSFAADYFETLLKIRDRAGSKYVPSQISSFHNDEDAHEMVKLANTFPKPPVEKLIIPKSVKTERKPPSAKAKGKSKDVPARRAKSTAAKEAKGVSPPKKAATRKGGKQPPKDSEVEEKMKEEQAFEVHVPEDEEEFLKSDPIKELVEKELMGKAIDGSEKIKEGKIVDKTELPRRQKREESKDKDSLGEKALNTVVDTLSLMPLEKGKKESEETDEPKSVVEEKAEDKAELPETQKNEEDSSTDNAINGEGSGLILDKSEEASEEKDKDTKEPEATDEPKSVIEEEATDKTKSLEKQKSGEDSVVDNAVNGNEPCTVVDNLNLTPVEKEGKEPEQSDESKAVMEEDKTQLPEEQKSGKDESVENDLEPCTVVDKSRTTSEEKSKEEEEQEASDEPKAALEGETPDTTELPEKQKNEEDNSLENTDTLKIISEEKDIDKESEATGEPKSVIENNTAEKTDSPGESERGEGETAVDGDELCTVVDKLSIIPEEKDKETESIENEKREPVIEEKITKTEIPKIGEDKSMDNASNGDEPRAFAEKLSMIPEEKDKESEATDDNEKAKGVMEKQKSAEDNSVVDKLTVIPEDKEESIPDEAETLVENKSVEKTEIPDKQDESEGEATGNVDELCTVVDKLSMMPRENDKEEDQLEDEDKKTNQATQGDKQEVEVEKAREPSEITDEQAEETEKTEAVKEPETEEKKEKTDDEHPIEDKLSKEEREDAEKEIEEEEKDKKPEESSVDKDDEVKDHKTEKESEALEEKDKADDIWGEITNREESTGEQPEIKPEEELIEQRVEMNKTVDEAPSVSDKEENEKQEINEEEKETNNESESETKARKSEDEETKIDEGEKVEEKEEIVRSEKEEEEKELKTQASIANNVDSEMIKTKEEAEENIEDPAKGEAEPEKDSEAKRSTDEEVKPSEEESEENKILEINKEENLKESDQLEESSKAEYEGVEKTEEKQLTEEVKDEPSEGLTGSDIVKIKIPDGIAVMDLTTTIEEEIAIERKPEAIEAIQFEEKGIIVADVQTTIEEEITVKSEAAPSEVEKDIQEPTANEDGKANEEMQPKEVTESEENEQKTEEVEKAEIESEINEETKEEQNDQTADEPSAKVEIIRIEEVEETRKDEPQEGIQIKTITTHLFDTLQVPETILKEYKVHRTKEDTTLPDISTYQTFQNDDDRREAVEEEKIDAVSLPESGMDKSDLLDIMTPSSGYSLNLSEMSMQTVSELFLDSEKHYSSLEKEEIRYTTRKEPEDKGEEDDDRKEVEEVISKTVIPSGVDAVPVEPRKPEEIKEAEQNVTEETKEDRNVSDESNEPQSRSIDSDTPFMSVEVKTVIETQVLSDEEEEGREDKDNRKRTVIYGSPDMEVTVETTIDVLDEGEATGATQDDKKTQSSEDPKPDSGEGDGKDSLSTEDAGGKEGSSGESDSTSSSVPTEIKRFDSSKKNLTRSSTQSLLGAQSLDSEKKKPLLKTKSLTTLQPDTTDLEVWGTIEKELERAATKIQSKYRGYAARKRLRREDAVQITTEESSTSTTPGEQEPRQQSTGELHDSIVLSVHPF